MCKQFARQKKESDYKNICDINKAKLQQSLYRFFTLFYYFYTVFFCYYI